MSDFTPDELERYKQWAESFKGPQMSSLDEMLEAQREAQAAAELTARGAKSAEKPLATLGEVAEKLKDVKVKPPLTKNLAEESARVFEEAGSFVGSQVGENVGVSLYDYISDPEKRDRMLSLLTDERENPSVTAPLSALSTKTDAANAFSLKQPPNNSSYVVPETPTPLLPVSEQSDYTVPERPTPLLPAGAEPVVTEALRPQPPIKSAVYTEKPSASPSVAPSPAPAATETKPDTALVQEEPSSRSRLEDALELQRQYELMAAISRGSEMMGRGIAGAISKTTPSKMSDGEFEKALSALGKQKVEGAKLLEEQDKKQQELDRAKRKRDPNSPESKYIRDYFAQLGLNFPETASAEIVEKFIPQTTAILNQREVSARLERQSKEKAQDRILLAREKAKEEQAEAITKSEEKREKIISQEKEKLEKRLAEPAQALLAITDFEMNLKNKYLNDPNFSLDDFDIKKFKGDLPGTNVPGFGRVSFYSSDARQLQRDIDTVLNQMIRAFAGKAVTKNELERIKSQFSSGAFNTAPEMIDAMAKAKKIARQGMKSSEAAFSKEAVQNFKEFGGITSDYGVKKKVIRKGYNRKTNQTQLIYEDGTKEIVEGEI